MPTPETVNIRSCSSCGEDHDGLFVGLPVAVSVGPNGPSVPLADDGERITFCPKTHETIYISGYRRPANA